MDSHVATLFKSMIAGLVVIFGLMLWIFMFQISQIQTFEQYARAVISRQGGITDSALKQIESESKKSYSNLFKISYDSKYSNKIQPYGTSIPFTVESKLTSLQNGIKVPFSVSVQGYSVAENRDNDVIPENDTTVIDQSGSSASSDGLLPTTSVIQISLSEYNSHPHTLSDVSEYNLYKLLQFDDSLGEFVPSNNNSTITGVTEYNGVSVLNQERATLFGDSLGLALQTHVKGSTNGSEYWLAPQKVGSTTFNFKYIPTGSTETVSRNYTLVVMP